MPSSPRPSPRPATRMTIVLVPDPSYRGPAPPIVRLRRALKLLLRAYGLRCVSVAPDAPAEAEARPPPR